jgi:hypothetical protein
MTVYILGSTFFSGEIASQRFKRIIHDRKAATQVLTAKYAEGLPEAWWVCFLGFRCTGKDIRNGFGRSYQAKASTNAIAAGSVPRSVAVVSSGVVVRVAQSRSGATSFIN